ncbi:hypothetical protein [Caballeronia cordobensis]|uniref:hypothetical protein n=1 Tax=Caballeronia cordobensis TaxID=1353886 RepID=UPI0006AD673D|nr:hypothetical protein [Caballeronia cordobensis]
MPHDFPPDRESPVQFGRWPNGAPIAAVAGVVLALNDVITRRRRAAAAWLAARRQALPLLPIQPSRLELAVIIALAETYGDALAVATRFLPVIDFIVERGAVVLVQRVMYGARPDDGHSDEPASPIAEENARLADQVREAKVAFEFLCATWPDVFMAHARAALSQGLQRLPSPPSTGIHQEGGDD